MGKLLHGPFLLLVLSCIYSSCSQPPQVKEDQLYDIGIGMKSTAIYGKILEIDKMDGQYMLTIQIDKSRQGGGAARTFSTNTAIEAILSLNNLRMIDEKRDSQLEKDIKVGMQIIAIVTSDSRNDPPRVNDLIYK